MYWIYEVHEKIFQVYTLECISPTICPNVYLYLVSHLFYDTKFQAHWASICMGWSEVNLSVIFVWQSLNQRHQQEIMLHPIHKYISSHNSVLYCHIEVQNFMGTYIHIPSATIVGPANDGYFGIIRNGLNCHWKRYGELGRLIKTYYPLDKFRAKVVIKILKIPAESSTPANRWRQYLGRAHWKVRSGHRASHASTVWHNAILQLVCHPRRLGVTGSVELNNCRDLLDKYAVSFENRNIKEIHKNLYCFFNDR